MMQVHLQSKKILWKGSHWIFRLHFQSSDIIDSPKKKSSDIKNNFKQLHLKSAISLQLPFKSNTQPPPPPQALLHFPFFCSLFFNEPGELSLPVLSLMIFGPLLYLLDLQYNKSHKLHYTSKISYSVTIINALMEGKHAKGLITWHNFFYLFFFNFQRTWVQSWDQD